MASTNLIPEKNINFAVYLEGTEELGNAEVTLPKLEPMSSEVKGAGIAGVFDSLVLGHFGSTTLSLQWRSVTESITKLAAHKTHSLDLYGALQSYDAGSGEHKAQQLHLFVKGTPKGPELGALNVGDLGNPQMEFEVLYMKLSLDGSEKIELDKLNYIYRVDGVDYLAGVRSALGKGQGQDMKIELSKPFEFEVGGKKVRHTVLEIPLEEMTGSDMIAVENQLQGEGKFTMLGDFSKQFQIRLASRALKIPVQILERLPLRDFNKVVTAVQGFLLGSESGSPEEEQEEKTETPLAKASNA